MTDVGLDVAEYLKYERGLLVGADEMEAFTGGVRDARAAVDRLEARIALAEARSGGGE
jgi:ubiquinone biosynthesis protein UbiJ